VLRPGANSLGDIRERQVSAPCRRRHRYAVIAHGASERFGTYVDVKMMETGFRRGIEKET
jgi:hypothetical protein